jgi:ABC-type multidrug transport system fused ATPase/permease subunit
MRDRLRGLRCAVLLAFRTAPRDATALLLLFAIRPLSAAATAYGLKVMVDAVREHDARGAVVAGLLIAAVSAVGVLFGFHAVALSTRLTEKTLHDLDRELMAQAASVPGVTHHENPEHLDALELIRAGRLHLAEGADVLALLLGSALRMLMTIGLLAGINPWLGLTPLLAVPTLAASSRSERQRQTASRHMAEEARRARHFFDLATSPAAAQELRIYGLRGELHRRHQQSSAAADTALDAALRKGTAINLAGWLLFSMGYGAVGYAIVELAARGQASLGDVVLALTLIASLSAQTAATTRYTSLVNRAAAVGSLLHGFRKWAERAIAVPVGSNSAPQVLRHGIELHNVTLQYPGQTRPALDQVSVLLPAGTVVGIVGANGAGKSTLMKLLTRMYEPNNGVILVDGIPLAEMDLASWRARCTAVFQDFVRFEFTAQHCVGMGDIRHVDDVERVREALAKAGATDVTDSLEQGLSTRLGESFADGTALSGGQWQKLAIARAMMRNAPLVAILDEPTAAIDAESEHALLELYARAARIAVSRTGAIVLLVSHRFTSLRHADLIVVMSGGKLVESGSHEALMSMNGIYSGLYSRQASAYETTTAGNHQPASVEVVA